MIRRPAFARMLRVAADSDRAYAGELLVRAAHAPTSEMRAALLHTARRYVRWAVGASCEAYDLDPTPSSTPRSPGDPCPTSAPSAGAPPRHADRPRHADPDTPR